jgi:hypothetical protein
MGKEQRLIQALSSDPWHHWSEVSSSYLPYLTKHLRKQGALTTLLCYLLTDTFRNHLKLVELLSDMKTPKP